MMDQKRSEKELIESFKSEANFEITYVYKSNGGNTLFNWRQKNIKQPYVVIIDSDDEVLPDCFRRY